MSEEEIKRPSVGCDPEFFLYNTETERYESAHDVVPGTKDDPFVFDDGLGSVQHDGAAVELGILPAFSKEDFVNNIEATLKNIRGMVDSKYEFHFIPTVNFEEDYYDELPDEVKEIGCSGDYCITTGDARDTPTIEKGTSHAGGHIHVGWREPEEGKGEDLPEIFGPAKYLASKMSATFKDYEGVESNDERAEHYSNNFRSKGYGVEYRSVHNEWIGSRDGITGVYDMTMEAIEDFNEDVRNFNNE